MSINQDLTKDLEEEIALQIEAILDLRPLPDFLLRRFGSSAYVNAWCIPSLDVFESTICFAEDGSLYLYGVVSGEIRSRVLSFTIVETFIDEGWLPYGSELLDVSFDAESLQMILDALRQIVFIDEE